MNQDKLQQANKTLFSVHVNLLEVLSGLRDAHKMIFEGKGPRQWSLTYPIYALEQEVRGVMGRVDSLREDIKDAADEPQSDVAVTLSDVLHQLDTDSDLENITGAEKYRQLRAKVRQTLAKIDPTNPQLRYEDLG